MGSFAMGSNMICPALPTSPHLPSGSRRTTSDKSRLKTSFLPVLRTSKAGWPLLELLPLVPLDRGGDCLGQVFPGARRNDVGCFAGISQKTAFDEHGRQ